MAMLGLIGGSLAAGSGLLVLMTWLETSLQKSLAPDAPRPADQPAVADDVSEEQPLQVAA